MTVTPLDIAALAETRRRDPNLAMALAIEAGRQSDATKPLDIKETTDEQARTDAKASPVRRQHVRG